MICSFTMKLLFVWGFCVQVKGQCGPDKSKPMPPGGCPTGGASGAASVSCPTSGTTFTGSTDYIGKGPKAAPLRGNVGCIDLDVLQNKRPTTTTGVKPGEDPAVPVNIYGPMENGFTSSQPGASCLGTNELPGGVDTNLAEGVINKYCAGAGETVSLLDYCGGHATPYHYHERLTCLYGDSEDAATKGHSTRIGTALDGNGIYGHLITGGCEPIDLDICGGRTGITPDSNGQEVYYYVVTNKAPFSIQPRLLWSLE